ncbi:MAG: hypothetical protein JXB45_01705, partial [Candidatus Krumholzibacteriota bacterium]|nr:hypothetical protein [Candidatus Krumholzibacteriota bacterium]
MARKKIPEKKSRDHRLDLLLILILLTGALIRVIFIVQLSRSDISDLLPLDTGFFRELAARISAGEGIPGGTVSFNPLYPFFLSLIFRCCGDGLVAPRIVQLLAGLLSIYLMYTAGRNLSRGEAGPSPRDEAVGLLAAALFV